MIKRLFFVAVFMVMATVNYSCDAEDVSETEENYQSVKKSEIDDGDT